MEGVVAWIENHVLELVGIGLGIPTLFFTWREWIRGRSIASVSFELRKLGEHDVLRVHVQSRRNRIFVRRVTLGRTAGASVPTRQSYAWDSMIARVLDIGDAYVVSFPIDQVKEIVGGERRHVRAFWWDAEDKSHGTDVPADCLRQIAEA